MMYDLLIPAQLMAALTPDIVLLAGTMVLMLLAAWRSESDAHQRTVGVGALLVLAATAGAVVWMLLGGAQASGSNGIIAVDGFRFGTALVCLLGAACTVALQMELNPRAGIRPAEAHVLVLFATSGMLVLAAARDLMIVFLGVELMSIPVYILVGLNRRSGRSAEAALKYFLLGAFSTGFLLYGIALVYGATGSVHLAEIGRRILEHNLQLNPMLLVGVGLLLVGFAFKVAAFPFHMWAPDVYEGAPTPITAFMASAVKAAAFATFLRVWLEAFGQLAVSWVIPMWWLAALTMAVGNVVALQQRNIKRLLAYSSIVHTGYLMVAVVAGTTLGSAAFLFYLLAYTLATFGAFAIVGALSRGADGEGGLTLDDYAGLWHVRPWLAVGMSVFLLALMGFPVFGGLGFFAKWYLMQAALQSNFFLVPLLVVLVLTSVISAGYYLNVMRLMFMSPRPEGAAPIAPVGIPSRLVLAGTALVLLGAGLLPGRLVAFTRDQQVQRADGTYIAAPREFRQTGR